MWTWITNSTSYSDNCYTKHISTYYKYYMGIPCRVMANLLDCTLKLSEFELQSHFRINTLGKGINPLIPSAMA